MISIPACVCLRPLGWAWKWHIEDFLEPRPPILSLFILRSSRSSAWEGMQIFGVDSDTILVKASSRSCSEPVWDDIRCVCVTSVVASISTLEWSGFVIVTLRSVGFGVFSWFSFTETLETWLFLWSLLIRLIFRVAVVLLKKIIYFLSLFPDIWRTFLLIQFVYLLLLLDVSS